MAHVNPIQLQKFLKGVDYPASKQALIDTAKSQGADENVCSTLEQLPDEDFQTPADVSQAFGKLSDTGGRRTASTGGNEFLAQATQDSLAEIELCELALQRSSNDQVKVFAQQMIDEHSQLGREMEQLASRKKLNLPKSMTPEHKSSVAEMAKLNGQDFDRKFIEHNVQDHEKDIKVFRHYAEQDSDSDIKSLAEKGVKMLSHHLQMAKDIEKQLRS